MKDDNRTKYWWTTEWSVPPVVETPFQPQAPANTDEIAHMLFGWSCTNDSLSVTPPLPEQTSADTKKTPDTTQKKNNYSHHAPQKTPLNDNLEHFKVKGILPHMMLCSEIEKHIFSPNELFTVYLFYISLSHLTHHAASTLLSTIPGRLRSNFNYWMNRILGAPQQWQKPPGAPQYKTEKTINISISLKFIEDASQPEIGELRQQEKLAPPQTLSSILSKDRTNKISAILLKGRTVTAFIKQAQKEIGIRKTLKNTNNQSKKHTPDNLEKTAFKRSRNTPPAASSTAYPRLKR